MIQNARAAAPRPARQPVNRLRLAAAALSALAALGLAPAPATAQPVAPVLVELYTSQGCNSCPPADAALGELAARPEIVALSLHVDYWDYLGWRDSFARPAHTKRQYAYRDAMAERVVYTPQMIIQGAAAVVGSHKAHLADMIAMMAEKPMRARIELASAEGGRIEARLSPGDAPGTGVLTVWTARYAKAAEVDIARGENGGKRLTYHNVVRELRALGRWAWQPATLALEAPGPAEGVAVWLQDGEAGPVVTAAKYER